MGSERFAYGKVAKIENGCIMVIDDEATKINYAEAEFHTLNVFERINVIYEYDSSKKTEKLFKSGSDALRDYESAGEKCSRVMVVTNTIWPYAIIIYNPD